jgi:hypothetical protein
MVFYGGVMVSAYQGFWVNSIEISWKLAGNFGVVEGIEDGAGMGILLW